MTKCKISVSGTALSVSNFNSDFIVVHAPKLLSIYSIKENEIVATTSFDTKSTANATVLGSDYVRLLPYNHPDYLLLLRVCTNIPSKWY